MAWNKVFLFFIFKKWVTYCNSTISQIKTMF